MPIYEYHCPQCGKVHELWQSIYNTDDRKCPECFETMQKLISKSSFQLKGGGWYADGYCKTTEGKKSDNKPMDATSCGKSGNNEKPVCETCS